MLARAGEALDPLRRLIALDGSEHTHGRLADQEEAKQPDDQSENETNGEISEQHDRVSWPSRRQQ
jgi:hypothetical protein